MCYWHVTERILCSVIIVSRFYKAFNLQSAFTFIFQFEPHFIREGEMLCPISGETGPEGPVICPTSLFIRHNARNSDSWTHSFSITAVPPFHCISWNLLTNLYFLVIVFNFSLTPSIYWPLDYLNHPAGVCWWLGRWGVGGPEASQYRGGET